MSDDQNNLQNGKDSNFFAKRREAIRNLIPEAFDADGAFDADALKNAIGVSEEQEEKRFGLVWPGKRQAIEMLSAPHRFHLYPDPDLSVDFDNTRNAFIEADNLVALRLMQNAYQGQVKLIYIDPPYNTGNDFVYQDDFEDSLEAYRSQCGITDQDGVRAKARSTSEGGRKHSPWLGFMYPRMVLARQMLRRDGAIVVACDDNEFANLRLMMNEIFGEENFVASIVWQGGRKNDSRFISVGHDYMIVFAKDMAHLKEVTDGWHVRKEGLDAIYDQVARTVAEVRAYHDSDWTIATQMLKDWFKNLDSSHPANAHKHYDHIDGHDERGNVFFPDNISWPGGGGPTYEVLHPASGKPVKLPNSGWRFPQSDKMQEMIAEDRIFFGETEDKVPTIKRYLHDTEEWAISSVIYQDRRSASKRLKALLGDGYFEFPKDETILARLIEAMSDDDDIVMDFFAGSGSTAHAVWLQNARDGADRRFVLCTLPEPIHSDKPQAKYEKAGYKVISQITIDRLKKSGEKVRADHPKWDGDVGFKVFRITESKRHSSSIEADDLQDFFEEAAHVDKSRLDDLRLMTPYYLTRFLMEAGYRLDARLEQRCDDIWRIDQGDRSGWITIPLKPGDLRQRLCKAGAVQGDDVILVEGDVSDSDMANCSAFFSVTAKRV